MAIRKNEYTRLIAGAHVDKEKFTNWVYELTEPLRIAKECLADLQREFDVDFASGKQLDAIGARVGVQRRLPVKLTDVYFALDDVEGIGLDLGLWKGRFDSDDGVTTLPDETYRAVIKAKILANHWNGQNESLPDILTKTLDFFGLDAKILDLQDLQIMHVALHLTKNTTPPVVWELFSRRLVDIAPAGVGLTILDNDTWFGFDFDTDAVKGFDQGHIFPFEKLQQGIS